MWVLPPQRRVSIVAAAGVCCAALRFCFSAVCVPFVCYFNDIRQRSTLYTEQSVVCFLFLVLCVSDFFFVWNCECLLSSSSQHRLLRARVITHRAVLTIDLQPRVSQRPSYTYTSRRLTLHVGHCLMRTAIICGHWFEYEDKSRAI